MNITAQENECFRELVGQRLGFHLNMVNIEDLLSKQLKEAGVSSLSAYLKHLKNGASKALWQKLSSALTVPETYFFRNKKQCQMFQEVLFSALVEENRQKPFRIWSAGTATGEESYTLAILCEELRRGRELSSEIDIIGTDLVEDYLIQARSGLYGKSSFRSTSTERQELFFQQQTADLWKVRERVAGQVRFEQLNLADSRAVDSFVEEEGPFDIIFFRNVLIYFQPDVIQKLLHHLVLALSSDGLLFMGSAEYPLMWTEELKPFRTSSDSPVVWSSVRGQGRSSEDVSVRSEKVSEYASGETEVSVLDSTEMDLSLAIRQVLELARRDHIDEALNAVRTLVEENRISPEVHYAYGVILELCAEPVEAMDSYGRAIFLDPNFSLAYWRQAMLHARQKVWESALHELDTAIATLETEVRERVVQLAEMDFEEVQAMMLGTREWLCKENAQR